MFGLSVFLRDGEDVYHTYFTDRRGVEHLGTSFSGGGSHRPRRS